MAEKKIYPCLQPKHVRRFRCDGSLCHSRCCRGWDVYVDERAHRRYLASGIRIRGKRIEDYEEQAGSDASRRFRMRENGHCPFLREDSLCDIQRTYGSSFLPAICAEFPRRSIVIGEMAERFLWLSCPVAARLALLPKEPMSFEWVDYAPTGQSILIRARKEGHPKGGPMADYLPGLQLGCISLLQMREIPLSERLLALGCFLHDTDQIAEKGRVGDAMCFFSGLSRARGLSQEPGKRSQGDPRLERYGIAAHAKAAADRVVVSSRPNPVKGLRQILRMMQALYGEGQSWGWGMDDELLAAMKDVLGTGWNAAPVPDTQHAVQMLPPEEAAEHLLPAYRDRILPMAGRMERESGHIMENFLVHEFFSHQYPCTFCGTFSQNYAVFLAAWHLARFWAACAALGRGGWDEELLVNVLGLVSMRVSHSAGYLESIARATDMPEEGAPFAWMGTWIG